MMTLDQYLKTNSMTETALAKAVGVTQPYIWRLRRNLRRASPDVAKRLEKATGIPAEKFVFAKVKPEAAKSDTQPGAAA